jgi:hypothetical protein
VITGVAQETGGCHVFFILVQVVVSPVHIAEMI